MPRLKVEYVPTLELKENANNAKKHPPEQLERRIYNVSATHRNDT